MTFFQLSTIGTIFSLLVPMEPAPEREAGSIRCMWAAFLGSSRRKFPRQYIVWGHVTENHNISGEESQKKRQITHVEICPGEWTIQATYWVTQSWDPTEGRGAPLAGWRPDGINNREACTSLLKNTWELTCCWGRASFPGGSVGKESACNVGDPGSCSGWGRSPGEGISNPLQYSCLENSMDRGAWLSYNPWDHELSDTWVTSTLTFWGRAERDGLSTAQVAVTSRYYLWHFCCW